MSFIPRNKKYFLIFLGICLYRYLDAGASPGRRLAASGRMAAKSSAYAQTAEVFSVGCAR